MTQQIKVKCMECGKKFKSASLSPQCSRCNSVDIEPIEEQPWTPETARMQRGGTVGS